MMVTFFEILFFRRTNKDILNQQVEKILRLTYEFHKSVRILTTSLSLGYAKFRYGVAVKKLHIHRSTTFSG